MNRTSSSTTRTTLLALSLCIFASGSALAGKHEGGYHGKRGGYGKAMLEKLDSNKDGQVSVAEIQQQANERARSMDADNDGTITAAEAQAWRDQQRAQRQAARFARFDSNGDGVVSTAEYAAAQTQRLSALDTNADGLISADEVKARHHGRRGGHGKHAQ